MTTDPLAQFTTEIDALAAEIRPLRERLSVLSKQRDEYANRLAAETDDITTLTALREHSTIAYRKLSRIVASTSHAALWGFIDWLPIEDDYSTGYAMGPHLAGDQMSVAKAGETWAADLAASMVDFAARFCDPAPELVDSNVTRYAGMDVCGMVQAGIVPADAEDRHSYWLYYAPDGTRAYVFDSYALGDVIAQGSLEEVLMALPPLVSVFEPYMYL